MYPNVIAEMARRKITLEIVAPLVNMTIATLSKKLNGESILTLNEAKILRDVVAPDMLIDELFEEAS